MDDMTITTETSELRTTARGIVMTLRPAGHKEFVESLSNTGGRLAEFAFDFPLKTFVLESPEPESPPPGGEEEPSPEEEAPSPEEEAPSPEEEEPSPEEGGGGGGGYGGEERPSPEG